MHIEDKLDNFLNSISVRAVSQEFSSPEKQIEAEELLLIYGNEARSALGFVAPYIRKNEKILEVGAGLCLLSFFLKKEGYDIVALEPSTGGFDFFSKLQNWLIGYFTEIDLQILHLKAEDITTESAGRFDLIFSHYVLEHIPNPTETLSILLKVMTEQGKMIHLCPNYHIPYEPHFNIPLVINFPELSKKIFGAKIRGREALWESLNFITYSEVVAFAKENDVHVTFHRGLLSRSLSRLDSDPIFRKRQGSWAILLIFFILKKTGLIKLVKYLPPAITTPMSFIIHR